MFYISDINDAIRELLNDKITPYRFSNGLISEYVIEALREIHRLRPDSRINDRGKIQYIDSLYKYTDTASYMLDYEYINGWDKYTYPTLYFQMQSSTSILIYPSASERSVSLNALATIANADSIGLKTITEANDSGFSGRVQIINPASVSDTWDVSAVEQGIDIDNYFISPIVDFTVSRCFDTDSEDLADAQLAQKHYQKFMGGIK